MALPHSGFTPPRRRGVALSCLCAALLLGLPPGARVQQSGPAPSEGESPDAAEETGPEARQAPRDGSDPLEDLEVTRIRGRGLDAVANVSVNFFSPLNGVGDPRAPGGPISLSF